MFREPEQLQIPTPEGDGDLKVFSVLNINSRTGLKRQNREWVDQAE